MNPATQFKIVSASILLLFTVNNAQAFFEVSKLQKAAEKVAQTKMKLGKKSNSDKCVSFAGQWEGLCQGIDGKEEKNAFDIIQHGCNHITFVSSSGRDSYRIEGLETDTSGDPIYQTSKALSVSWNQDKTIIQASLTLLMTSPLFSGPINGGASVQMLRDGDKLKSFSKQDIHGEEKENSCIYDLKK